MRSYRWLAWVVIAGSWLVAHTACCEDTADLAGRWLHEEVSADGNHVQTIIVLKQDHTKLSGRVIFSWGEIPIRDGVVDGHHFWFDAMTPADSEHPAHYAGILQGQALQIDSHWPGNNNSTYTATRTFDTAGDPPARIPPPALLELSYNGLAATPPMGWNSWNHFQGAIDDKTVREVADAMVSSGMRDAGYVFVNIDESWQGERDATGNIRTNRKFPDMRALADYVHSKGLKLGIYSSPGPKSCGGYEGSYGHEEQDAATYARWDIDYLKYDWCSAGRIYGNGDLRAVYQKMGTALRKTGHPMVYSFCEYGMGDVWKWAPSAGANLWRTTGDIQDSWKAMEQIGFNQSPLAAYAGPGHWNDPDMLEVGNGGMTETEYRTHMTLWAMLAAPLLAGNDPRHMTPEILSILTNREVIAIDQDPLGHSATRAWQEGPIEVWTRPLADGTSAVAIFNRGDSDRGVSLTWSRIGLTSPDQVHDLWSHLDLAAGSSGFQSQVPSHGTVLLRTRRPIN